MSFSIKKKRNSILEPELTSFFTYSSCIMVWRYVIFASRAVPFLVENQSNNQIDIEATMWRSSGGVMLTMFFQWNCSCDFHYALLPVVGSWQWDLLVPLCLLLGCCLLRAFVCCEKKLVIDLVDVIAVVVLIMRSSCNLQWYHTI